MLISSTPRVQLRRSVMSFDCTKHINPMALMSIYSFMGATHCLQWIQINSISKLFIIHTALKYHSFGKFLFYNWFYTIVRSQRKAVIGPLQLFKERPKWRCKGHGVTGLRVHTLLHITLSASCVQQVSPCDLDWDSGLLGMWAFKHYSSGMAWSRSRQCGCDLSRSGVLRVTDLARLDCGSLSTGRPTALMSAHRTSPTVGAFLRLCLLNITLPDHPNLKKCPGRFKFSQECGPSEHPPAHLDPS